MLWDDKVSQGSELALCPGEGLVNRLLDRLAGLLALFFDSLERLENVLLHLELIELRTDKRPSSDS